MANIKYIDEADIQNKRVLLRADFDVSRNADLTIADDARIQFNLPTIKHLLAGKNKLICIAKLDRPKTRSPETSLKIVVDRLQEYLPDKKVILVDDFLTDDSQLKNQTNDQIVVLENIRFYPQEKANDPEFAKKLASYGDIYVNDSFSMCHRSEASTVGIPKLLPAYAGLQLRHEIQMISKVIDNPQKPLVAIIGGSKISTKINIVGRLNEMADYLLIGGGLANILLSAKGLYIGKSFIENDSLDAAKKLMTDTLQKNTKMVLPEDAVVGQSKDGEQSDVKKVEDIAENEAIYDIGPETQAKFGAIIAKAKTIIWNGPLGYIENPRFKRGTDFVYYSIADNAAAVSVVGGGDTLTAISKKEYLDKITHISLGGGAMLEFIEKGTLPGIEALKQ